jgi:hypothetical protein
LLLVCIGVPISFFFSWSLLLSLLGEITKLSGPSVPQFSGLELLLVCLAKFTVHSKRLPHSLLFISCWFPGAAFSLPIALLLMMRSKVLWDNSLIRHFPDFRHWDRAVLRTVARKCSLQLFISPRFAFPPQVPLLSLPKNSRDMFLLTTDIQSWQFPDHNQAESTPRSQRLRFIIIEACVRQL